MARGRKKNLTLPPSRSLDHQRAFRERKAQYVANLEERCHNAEAENEALRQELASLRAALATNTTVSNVDPEMIRVSAELMHTLASASSSLARFQELAQRNPAPRDSMPTGTVFQRVPSLTYTSTASTSTSEFDHETVSNASDDLYGPNCCGGMLDCRGLIEEDAPDPDREELHSRECCAGLVDCTDLIQGGHPVSQERTSVPRSTSQPNAFQNADLQRFRFL